MRLELSVTKRDKGRKISQKYQIHTQGKGLGGFCREDVFGMDSSIEYWGIDNRTILDEFLGAFFFLDIVAETH